MTIIDFNDAKLQGELRKYGVDAHDIGERLNASAQGFAEWLFSGRAAISKHEARIGDVYGTPGESLSIQLTGRNAGSWYDHATEEGGDLIGLYRKYMGYAGTSDFQISLKEIAKDFLGDPIEVERSSWRATPQQVIEKKKAELGTKPPAHITELGAPVESYPYNGRDGKVICVVRRYEPGGEEDGKPKKTFRASPGFPTPRPLYRIPQIIQATHVVLVEGERCAEALASMGIEATTAMGGANTKIEMVDWSPLAGKLVTIWPDKDPKGIEYAQRAAQALAGLGCKIGIVTPPEGKPDKWDAADCCKEGGDPNTLISGATLYTGAAEAPQGSIPIISMAELRARPESEWILDGWIPFDSIGFVFGEPGGGKSFFVLDWCMHIAYGMPEWHGVAIRKPGPILYILQEGGRGTVNRVDAWKRHHGKTEDPPGLEFITVALSFLDAHCVETLIEAVKARKQDYRLIVVDTVSRVLPGADENLQKEMTLFIAACDRLRRVCSSAIIGVHHAGKSGEFRGSTVLLGAGDFVFKTEKEKGVNPITITCNKLKDEEDGWHKTLKLEKISLSDPPPPNVVCDVNKIVTSLVITGIVPTEVESGKPPEGGKGKWQKAVLDALKHGPLGRTRLTLMTRCDNSGTLSHAISGLIDKGLIMAVENGDKTEWELVL